MERLRLAETKGTIGWTLKSGRPSPMKDSCRTFCDAIEASSAWSDSVLEFVRQVGWFPEEAIPRDVRKEILEGFHSHGLQHGMDILLRGGDIVSL